jgi:CHAD domain-containing protein
MAPGLAGFVVCGDDPATWDDVVAAVVAALARAFAVVPERGGAPAGARRRTWFDTFDWRLYSAGLALEYVAARRGGELHLTGASPAHRAANALPATGQASGESRASRRAAVPDGVRSEERSDERRGKTARAGGPEASGESADLTQPVTGWQPSRPHLLPDLPDGPLADRVADLVSPRALLPAVSVISTATVSRLLNEDGKTVARLILERVSVTSGTAHGKPAAEGGNTSLAPRMTIAEVRGYPGQARRAARIVALAPGVRPATETVFAEALRAIGRQPGDYSNKVDAPITATMPAQQAAARILLRLLDTIEANVPGVLNDCDTEFLHDLRVSVRRTRAALKLFGDALAAPANDNANDNGNPNPNPNPNGKPNGKPRARLTDDDVARFAAEFKWVGDLTTPTRDLDVHLLGFEQTARTLKAAKPDDLEPFRAYLEQRRVKEDRALARGLRSARFAALTTQWRAALTKLRGAKRNTRTATTLRSGQPVRRDAATAGTLAAERTRRAFAKVVKRGTAITPASPHESLHELRKRCKELRYALEFFAPLHDPAEYRKVIDDLKRLQDCLGEFQDTQVQIEEIQALAAAMQAAGEAPAPTLLAMGEITAGLAARQAAARAAFERRFAAFAGPDGQRRMSVLVGGGEGGGGGGGTA